jgi:penicillin V acylase-like amidase (Ntn superfamily)
VCTRALWPDAAGAVLVGRNMDFARDLGTNLWAFPRGIERDNGVGGELRWQSGFGSLVASAAGDIVVVDGLNEARLGGHLLVLSESDYGERDESRPALAMAVWLQYILDNFATVADAVAWIEESQVQIVPQSDPFDGRAIGLHLALDDASGDSAIVEYLDGTPRVWHDRSYTVMTNSPPFAEQLERLKSIDGLGGTDVLPGGTDADQRFARAAYYLTRLPAPASGTEAIASLLSVMRNAAQPFRIPDPDKPYASETIWRTVADLTHGIYVYESTTRPNVVWARIDGLDLDAGAPVRKLDLAGDTGLEGGLVGDVTDRFAESQPMRFLAVH